MFTPTPWQKGVLDDVQAALDRGVESISWEGRLPGSPDQAQTERLAGVGKGAPLMGRTTLAIEVIRMACRFDPSMRRPEVRAQMLRQLAAER